MTRARTIAAGLLLLVLVGDVWAQEVRIPAGAGVAGYGGKGATFHNFAVSNPTGATTAGAVMMGMGATCKITPTVSTRVYLQVTGELTNSILNDGVLGHLRYGTGAAPANQAALSGSQLSQNTQINAVATAGLQVPFTVMGIATGLTPGAQVWFDMALVAVTGGTGSIVAVTCTAFEM